jgi:hypothetical protein
MRLIDDATDEIGVRVSTVLFVLLIAVAATISCMFIITYPLNTAGAGDAVTYLRMMISGNSNLIHASGGPFIVASLLQLTGITGPLRELITGYSVLGLTPPLMELDTAYLFDVLLAQYAIHFTIISVSLWMCVRCFGIFAGGVLLLAWTINVAFLSNVTSTLPDWLLGDMICLATVLCAAAYVSDRKFLKAAAYLGASFVLVWAFLVKYNAAIFVAMLLALILSEAASWRWRLIVTGCCAAIFASVVALYVQFVHLPSTGTTDLNYDHAWVLMIPVGQSLKPSNGINTQRWIALNAILPPFYNAGHAYRNVNDIAPPEELSKYRDRYEQIMQMSETELRDFINKNPLPPTFDVYSSAIPLYYYVGLRETDELGIKVFLEYLAANPITHIKKVLQRTFTITPASEAFPIVPLPNRMGKLEPGKNLANSFREVKGAMNYSYHYWSPELIVWWPGAQFFEWLNGLVPIKVIETIALMVGFAGVLCSPSIRVKKLSAVIVAMWFIYVMVCWSLGLVRFKEFAGIWPFTCFMLAIGTSQVALAISRRGHIIWQGSRGR